MNFPSLNIALGSYQLPNSSDKGHNVHIPFPHYQLLDFEESKLVESLAQICAEDANDLLLYINIFDALPDSRVKLTDNDFHDHFFDCIGTTIPVLQYKCLRKGLYPKIIINYQLVQKQRNRFLDLCTAISQIHGIFLPILIKFERANHLLCLYNFHRHQRIFYIAHGAPDVRKSEEWTFAQNISSVDIDEIFKKSKQQNFTIYSDIFTQLFSFKFSDIESDQNLAMDLCTKFKISPSDFKEHSTLRNLTSKGWDIKKEIANQEHSQRVEALGMESFERREMVSRMEVIPRMKMMGIESFERVEMVLRMEMVQRMEMISRDVWMQEETTEGRNLTQEYISIRKGSPIGSPHSGFQLSPGRDDDLDPFSAKTPVISSARLDSLQGSRINTPPPPSRRNTMLPSELPEQSQMRNNQPSGAPGSQTPGQRSLSCSTPSQGSLPNSNSPSQNFIQRSNRDMINNRSQSHGVLRYVTDNK